VTVNSKAVTGAKPGGYLAVRRGGCGDVIQLEVEMTPEVIQGNPRIADDTGRVAVQRGPLIYVWKNWTSRVECHSATSLWI